jgi:hypothetical protein
LRIASIEVRRSDAKLNKTCSSYVFHVIRRGTTTQRVELPWGDARSKPNTQQAKGQILLREGMMTLSRLVCLQSNIYIGRSTLVIIHTSP